MRKLLILSLFAATTGGFAASAPFPAAAQTTDRIIDIYGTDRCPSSGGQGIVVCHRHPETERYRIPQTLREQEIAPQKGGGNVNAVAAVNSTGQTGTMQVDSCGTIGAGVNTGCVKKEADAWKAEKRAEKKAEEGVP